MILTETWLNNCILSAELFDKRNNVFRRNKADTGFHNTEDGGEVLIAVAKKFVATRGFAWESECEELWATVNVTSSFKISICALYLPPPVQYSMFEHFIAKFNSDFVHVNNFKQSNSILNIKTKVLDLVLTEYSQCRVEEATHNLVKIDPYHPPLEIVLQSKLDNNLNYKDKITRLNFRRVNYFIIKHQRNKIIWHEVFHGHDNPNDVLKLFYDAVNQVIKQRVPSTTLLNHGGCELDWTVQSSSHPPWFSKSLVRLYREKNSRRKRYNKYKNPMDKVAFRSCSKQC